MTSVDGGSHSYSYDACYQYAMQNHFVYFALQDGTGPSDAMCMVSNDLCEVVQYHGFTAVGNPVRSVVSPIDGQVYGGDYSNAVCLVRIIYLFLTYLLEFEFATLTRNLHFIHRPMT